ncbi:MBL fold metallo-hydrolase [Flavitalea flava]
MTSQRFFSLLFLLLYTTIAARSQQTEKTAAFTVVPLGVKGGLDESNLSAYMVAPEGSADFICLDAGTLYAGIRKAVNSGIFQTSVSEVLQNNIKAYFISHPHLDHVAGLILNSPDDKAKTIYGLPSCLDVLKDKYFTWESWANFGDAGEKPFLHKYHYAPLTPGLETAIDHTALMVTAFPLSHGNPYQSTAFLVSSAGVSLLYLGDTGADSIEHSDKLGLLWKAISPLIKGGTLKAIFIEVSFPDSQPDKLLFGHLTPRLLLKEMTGLGGLTGMSLLRGLPVVITHRKPSGDQETIIRNELEKENTLGLRLVYPEQGKALHF